MNITLEDLAAKRVKSAEGLVVSDHTLDLAKFTGSELVFTGKGTRGLVLKNSHGVEILFKDAVIDNASTGVTLKFDGVTDQISLIAENSKLFGKAGNSASQMIYFIGTWSNIEVGGFEIDQRRNSIAGSTVTGANLQFAGVYKAGHNLGNVHIHDMIYRNSGDEGSYVNKYTGLDGAAFGNSLLVERCKSFNSGRDPFQDQGFREVIYRDCYGENAGLEQEKNHISLFSLNGGAENILIENCEGKNMPQFMFVSTEGANCTLNIVKSRFTQGTHAGPRSNQVMYFRADKGQPFKVYMEGNTIDAPNVVKALMMADGSHVTHSGNKFNSGVMPLSRVDHGGSVKELPLIKVEDVTAQLETTEIGDMKTEFLLYRGQRFLLS